MILWKVLADLPIFYVMLSNSIWCSFYWHWSNCHEIFVLWYLYSCVCVYVCVCESLSCVRLFATPWTIACQASLSMEFSRQEYWIGLPVPSSGVLPNPGIKPTSHSLLPCRQILYHWATREAPAPYSSGFHVGLYMPFSLQRLPFT